jgi:prepilin-type N-terminal cleavage/methylation domain-containing protein
VGDGLLSRSSNLPITTGRRGGFFPAPLRRFGPSSADRVIMNATSAPNARRGVTLIELFAVIVLVGILATLALPRLMNARTRAMETAVMSDLRNLATTQEAHLRMHGEAAASAGLLGVTSSRGVHLDIRAASESGWAAQATHTSLPGFTCGVWAGDVDPELGAPATASGQVRCAR